MGKHSFGRTGCASSCPTPEPSNTNAMRSPCAVQRPVFLCRIARRNTRSSMMIEVMGYVALFIIVGFVLTIYFGPPSDF